MGFFNKIVTFFMPQLILREAEVSAFTSAEKETTRFNLIIMLPVIAITYVLHYFYFDQPMGLTSKSIFWFYFRFGMAVASIFGFILYYKILKPRQRFYRLYAVLLTSAVIFFQAIATKLYPEAPVLYPYVFTLVSIYLLRLTVLQNLIYCLVNSYIATDILLNTPNSPRDIYSAFFITLAIALFISSRNLSSILLYKSNLENLSAQKQLIERQIEIVDHLRGFLPKQIFKRFHELSSIRKYSTTYALDEILRPKNKEICCLFSDIRGYTKQSKNYALLEEQILPVIKESSITVEDNYGISRKIGDLVFAYFDEELAEENIANSLKAALSMAYKQSQSSNAIQISRSIILSYGMAIVGNIGGADSSIEITAMGTPSNECARIDEFIKKDPLFYNKIVLSPSFHEKLLRIHQVEHETYELTENELIRDFPEIKNLYYVDFKKAKNLLSKTQNIIKAGAA